MSARTGFSLRTWLIIAGVAIVAAIVVGIIWGEGPAAGLLALFGGGAGLSNSRKKKLLDNAEAARAEADNAATEARAASEAYSAAASDAGDYADRVDADMVAQPALDAAADQAARAAAADAGRAVLDAPVDDDDDLLIPDSTVAQGIRGDDGTGGMG